MITLFLLGMVNTLSSLLGILLFYYITLCILSTFLIRLGAFNYAYSIGYLADNAQDTMYSIYIKLLGGK